jgi:hypothetical protein
MHRLLGLSKSFIFYFSWNFVNFLGWILIPKILIYLKFSTKKKCYYASEIILK